MQYKHSPLQFFSKLQSLGFDFRTDEITANNERFSILDITGTRKDPEYMVYIDGKCKLPIRDEETIIKLITTLCKKKQPGKVHELRVTPEEFTIVAEGLKTFEYHKKDRDYQVGDMLIFREFILGSSTGRYLETSITYILELENNYVIMSIETEA